MRRMIWTFVILSPIISVVQNYHLSPNLHHATRQASYGQTVPDVPAERPTVEIIMPHPQPHEHIFALLMDVSSI